MSPYAEVIGDPIGHSLSPRIHLFWLKTLGIEGDYRAVETSRGSLGSYLESRRRDDGWRGCNLTAPLKVAALHLVDHVALRSRGIGAINCIVSRHGRLVGHNSDLDGIAEALGDTPMEGAAATIIGAGGAAWAAMRYLASRDCACIRIVTRNSSKAAKLRRMFSGRTDIEMLAFDQSDRAMAGAIAIINASPLGMAHGGPMPEPILASLARAAQGATAFDMVYDPPGTQFLETARAADIRTVDGLTMVIGQARQAFELFFGAMPPRNRDDELRALIQSQRAARGD